MTQKYMWGMEGVVGGLKFCVCSLSPAGSVGGYDTIRSWEYICDVLYWLFVRNVIDNRGGGGERQDYA